MTESRSGEIRLDDVDVYYGSTPALRGVRLMAKPGRIVAILGRNGAGKTTALKAIAGLARIQAGQVLLDGRRIDALPVHRISRLGISLVPQTRRIFTDLTVEENLQVARTGGRNPARERLARAFELFPKLAERRGQPAATLSGGEQQMLAIARALMTNPRVLLLDEPMEGLAPTVVDQVVAAMVEFRRSGMTIILVEQLVAQALDLADHVYVLDRGAVVRSCVPADLLADPGALRTYLGIGSKLIS